tara:strand:+ start:11417 stop:12163 length:747 start_codon:yes stop_codon:yes gene_type:complete
MVKKLNNKGIILAGGSGTRLYPLTKITSKQLLPIYDKPMIYYPLRLLVEAGIDNILIITTPHDQANFISLLGNGEEWGVKISYKKQKKPEGIAQAFIIAKEWLENSNVTLILGDNLFFGNNIANKLKNAIQNNQGATIFGYEVNNPNRFGVIEFDSNKNVISIKEKPKQTKSNWAVTGLYVYNKDVYEYSKTLKKSERGELEITDLNLAYLKNKQLKVECLDQKNYSWLDTGTFEAMLEASNYVKNNL